LDVSVVLPYVHGYPEIIQTLFAFQNEFVDENLSFELVVVENREKDPYTDRFLQYFRVPIHLGIVKYAFEPIPCGPLARQTGVKLAEGKYILLTDSHIQPGKDTVPMMIDFLEENSKVGSVHGCTVKSHIDLKRGAGCHYDLFGGTINLYSHFHGRYQRCQGTKPYQVAGASLAYCMFRREEFLKLRGYNENCRGYPHPEGYVPLKYMMFGYECYSMPLAWHLHSNYPRNYGVAPKVDVEVKGQKYRLVGNDNLIRNAMVCGYTLGNEKWLDRISNEWESRGGRKKILDAIKQNVLEVAQDEHEWVMQNAKYGLNEVLTNLYNKKVRGMEYCLIEELP